MTGISITRKQMADLLKVCSQFDGRVLEPATFEAWFQLLQDLPYEDIEQAIAGHYRESTAWIMPAHIVERCRAAAAARAVEAVRRNPPACWGEGCTVRYRLSDRPGSVYALPSGVHAETCSPMLNGVLTFDARQPAWSIMTVDPATFDEVAWEAGAAEVAARMARYREIVTAEPGYGPREDQGQ